jgi:hypothetical protein
MMRCAQALAIRWIECRSAIAQFNDVVSIDPVLRLGIATAVASGINGLASAIGSGDDDCAPDGELLRIVNWVDLFFW